MVPFYGIPRVPCQGVAIDKPQESQFSVEQAEIEVERGICYCSDSGANTISLSRSYYPSRDMVAYSLEHEAALVLVAASDEYRHEGDRGSAHK